MMTRERPAGARQTTSATTSRSEAFVVAHRDEAVRLGTSLADAIQDPDAFAALLGSGLARLGDPEVVEGQHRVAPGLGPTYGVRTPLLDEIRRAFRQATRDDRPTTLLYVVDRLFREPRLEARWFAFGLLGRTLPVEPERSWQLLRRAAREAGEWITVDTLARSYAAGILAESYRWAELEQLVYSPSRWERRLVGSTIATIPFEDRVAGRLPEVADRALAILATLIGDHEPDVQKALSWAYRSVLVVDAGAVTAAMRTETAIAADTDDGHRAWVIRDTLGKLDPAVGAELRTALDGIRRRPGAPSTSQASELATRFGGLPDPAAHPEPPLG